ncbi:MAG TPA: sugar ABC transporter permease [Opitutaceae bacterium]|nr:sugar ABC transporter permease [Opitutaceae bacterium]HND62286.1 sugar ABC transporter permease [Opitutaceae bacterium]
MSTYRPHPRWAPWAFIAPFVILFAVFTAWPLLRSLQLAFEQTYGPQTTVFVGLKNFRYLLTDPLFWRAVTNTVEFTVWTVGLQVPIALGLALLLNRPNLRGRAVLRLIFFSPSLVGLVFVAMLFMPIFEKRTGLLNVWLHALWPAWNLEFPWFETYTMTALVIAAVWTGAGFMMVYFLAALQHVPAELLEAAQMDGAGPVQRFWHVVLPEIRPVLGLMALLSFVGCMQLFELSYLMLGDAGSAGARGFSIVMYLYQMGFTTGDLGYASAIGWVLALFLMAVASAQRRLARRQLED